MGICCGSTSTRKVGQSSGGVDSTEASGYEALDPGKVTELLLAQLQNHALLAWVFLPACSVLQWALPPLRPDCAHGYSNWVLLVVLLIVLHHVYAESTAWSAAKALLTPPEL